MLRENRLLMKFSGVHKRTHLINFPFKLTTRHCCWSKYSMPIGVESFHCIRSEWGPSLHTIQPAWTHDSWIWPDPKSQKYFHNNSQVRINYSFSILCTINNSDANFPKINNLVRSTVINIIQILIII